VEETGLGQVAIRETDGQEIPIIVIEVETGQEIMIIVGLETGVQEVMIIVVGLEIEMTKITGKLSHNDIISIYS
jgi:hypothetical protein